MLDIIKTVKLGARCQMVLPAEIRKQLGIKKGDEIIIKIRGKKAIIEPKPKSYAEHLWGLHKEVWAGTDPDKYVKEERDQWEK
ncbi:MULTISPECIES: AbrB/MazE/SpoVT family DNA-binding domain-containing protein [Neomoorella]|uniref:SpoVT / AbrB like domain protein n=4 Tax=Neomoorella TaxID=44260 RepID=A0A1J5KAC6_NEOTH|nr:MULTISPECIES: AbrB/MazE/SpoVT family DNA-binding domain-containing protein [Moorella]GAF26399.1 AbrB family transcriptional regulator [Moorella thermoacetica Y72]AKX93430.1 SpoVT / AbrB like domain protein [Moorella thermoacetica]AKX96078.1 SpoVT / AbrB like domain protein [Moorella thermoacetica]APC07807.1 SpoVT / AbrB like domain protein [Moorella thermoacetica]OIQ09922.1 SpoVT / AbrB like domain protein [Moorella thermoacetica]